MRYFAFAACLAACGSSAEPAADTTTGDSGAPDGDVHDSALEPDTSGHDSALAPATTSGHDAADGDVANPTSVARYEVLELTFAHPSAGLANPWQDVAVRVRFESPSRSFEIGGFYYAADTWKARVAPDE